MALATRCPKCKTAFRVALDQLKLRAGLVRCGTCKEIFNGIENLLDPTEEFDTEKNELNKEVSAKTGANLSTQDNASKSLWAALEDSSAPAPPTPAVAKINTSEISPPTGLLRAASVESPPKDSVNLPGEKAPQTTFKRSLAPIVKPAATAFRKSGNKQRTQTTSTSVKPIPELVVEPDFIQREQLAQGQQQRLRPIAWTLGSVLAVLLVLQTIFAARVSIAAHFPDSRPKLEHFCNVLGCRVGLPAEIDAVSIESSELQPLDQAPGKFLLNILLRNRSNTAQAWPAIELSLQDANDKTIGRRILNASQYLPAGASMTKGFTAMSEQPLKMQFDLSQLKASGYRVYVFYP